MATDIYVVIVRCTRPARETWRRVTHEPAEWTAVNVWLAENSWAWPVSRWERKLVRVRDDGAGGWERRNGQCPT